MKALKWFCRAFELALNDTETVSSPVPCVGFVILFPYYLLAVHLIYWFDKTQKS